ncbi:MAG: PEGA domain-containing protein [Myxococcota bacterium]
MVTPPPKVEPPPKVHERVVEKVALTIKTVPATVEVYEGDVLVGTTPFTLERPKDSPPVELRFEAKGYKPATRKVGFVAAQDVVIELDKEKAAGGPKKKPSGLADDPYQQEDDLKDNPFD